MDIETETQAIVLASIVVAVSFTLIVFGIGILTGWMIWGR